MADHDIGTAVNFQIIATHSTRQAIPDVKIQGALSRRIHTISAREALATTASLADCQKVSQMP
jgi:hypothetical protein